MTSSNKSMINHLRDMFNGSFDEDLIESVLIQRDWNVDRALDDLMALTTGCTFNIPAEDFDLENIPSKYEEVNMTDSVRSLQANCINNNPNAVTICYSDRDGNEDRNESEDDVIVLHEEEYCLPVESDSEEENVNEKKNSDSQVQQTENNPSTRISYAAAVAKEKSAHRENNAAHLKAPDILYSGYTSYGKIKKTRDSLERVKLYVQESFKIMVILRGCPGSGKSYLAKSIMEECGITNNYYYYIHSTDNYFYLNKKGIYLFDAEKLPEAHRWNQINVLHVAREGLTPIVIDNTNTQMWNMQDYVKIAVCAGYEIEVMEPDTFWAYNVSYLAKKNHHCVPKEKIKLILEKYEHNISALSLLKNFNLEYTPGNAPPQIGTIILKNPELKIVFDNIFNIIHVLPTQSHVKLQSTRKKAKKLKKAERKTTKIEKELKEMVKKELKEIVKKEQNISNAESENNVNEQMKKFENEEFNFSSIKLANNTEVEISSKNYVIKDISKSSLTNLKDDVNSDTSWSTVDNSDNNSDVEYFFENEAELSSEDYENDTNVFCKKKTSFSVLNETSNEQLLNENNEICGSICGNNDETEDLMKFSDDENEVDNETKENSLTTVASDSLHSVNTMVNRLKNPIDLDSNEASVEAQESKTFKFSNQLYDALAKNGSRLKCFTELHNNKNDVESETANYCHNFHDSDKVSKDKDHILNAKQEENNLVPEKVSKCIKNENFATVDIQKGLKNVINIMNVEENGVKPEITSFIKEETENLSDDEIPKSYLQNELLPEQIVSSQENEIKENSCEFPKDLLNDTLTLNLDQSSKQKYLWNITKNSLTEDSKSVSNNFQFKEFASIITVSPDNINSENVPKPTDIVTYSISENKNINLSSSLETKIDDDKTDISDGSSSCLLNDLIHSDNLQFSGNDFEGENMTEQNINISHSIPVKNKSPDKDENTFKLDYKTFFPVQNKKNKLCNIENQRCNEADLLQTFLNQDIYKNNRNENDVNVDDILNSPDKFQKGFESTDISSSLIKNVIGNKIWGENFEDDVNVFESQNRRKRSNHLHLSDFNTAPLEDNSENSDYGTHSSSSEELGMDDIHNSVNRFVNNDINCDQGERKIANINRDKGTKNKYVPDDNSNESLCWSVESTLPELNTLKERILINSLDKVFNQSAKNSDQDVISTDIDADLKEFKQFNLSNSRKSGTFQMIENRLHDKNVENVNSERSSIKQDNNTEISDDVTADRADTILWDQWMCGDSWEEDNSKEVDISNKDKIEAKPPRTLKDSPSKQKNSETASIRLVNDIRNASDNSKIQSLHEKKTKNFDIVQRLSKSSNYQSTNELMHHYVRESRDHEEDHLTAKKSPKHINSSISYPLDAVFKKSFEDEIDEKRKISDSVAENNGLVWPSKQINFTLSYSLNGVPKKSSFEGETEIRKNSEFEENDHCGWHTKWVNLSSTYSPNFTVKNPTYDEEILKLLNPIDKQDDYRDLKLCKNPNTETSMDCSSLNFEQYWKRNIDDNKVEDVENVLRNLQVQKSSPFSENSNIKDTKLKKSDRRQKSLHFTDNNFFIPAEVLNLGRNKATNTGTDCLTGSFLIAHCREINKGYDNDNVPIIELRYKRDKSTMTEGNPYTVKAKPLREDLSNLFPSEMADAILDLYEKCQGNMDWIIEILMEDGFSPSDDQLEYLSSLQNVPDCNSSKEAVLGKNKSLSEKKKGGRKSGKNENKNQTGHIKNLNLNRVSADLIESCDKNNVFTETASDEKFNDSEQYVELFVDRTTVSQLEKYFGNPTVYPIKDYQPVIMLPVSLAQQIHACLIESVIDQAEKNEYLINQLNEEEEILRNMEQDQNILQEFTAKDMTDVENSLSDILVDSSVINSKFELGDNETLECVDEEVKSVRNEDSFASKLSLNLLLKGFPNIDPVFVTNTFKSQNFSYYATKQILNQYRKEVSIGSTEGNPQNVRKQLLEDNDDDDIMFDRFPFDATPRNEVIEQVKHFRNESSFNYKRMEKCREKLKMAVQQKKFGVAAYYREIMNVFKRKYEQCNAQASAILVTASCFQNTDIIDLHFFKVSEAVKALDLFLDHHIIKLIESGRSKMVLYIITGRGARSIDGVSHLQPPVKELLKRRKINYVVEPTNPGMVKAVILKTSMVSSKRRY